MLFRRQRIAPQRAGTPRETAAHGSPVVTNAQGEAVTLPAPRHALWALLDGERDVPALARALGWPETQVWTELDALADDGLLQRRAAPPAGGAMISRRRLLRGGVPALAMAAPVVAMAQSSSEATGKVIDAGQELLDKASAEEATKAATSEQIGKLGAANQEQSAKNIGSGINGELSSKSGAEQSNKIQEINAKVGATPTNAAPEPGTLALVGLAGAVVYLQHHVRQRDTERPAAQPPTEAPDKT